MGNVELDQIVAKQEVRAHGEVVQLSQRLIEIAARLGKDDSLTGVRSYPGERVDAPGSLGYLKVYRKTARQPNGQALCCYLSAQFLVGCSLKARANIVNRLSQFLMRGSPAS